MLNFFLSRAQHDELITRNQTLVNRLYKHGGKSRWSLPGVTWFKMPVELVREVSRVIRLTDVNIGKFDPSFEEKIDPREFFNQPLQNA